MLLAEYSNHLVLRFIIFVRLRNTLTSYLKLKPIYNHSSYLSELSAAYSAASPLGDRRSFRRYCTWDKVANTWVPLWVGLLRLPPTNQHSTNAPYSFITALSCLTGPTSDRIRTSAFLQSLFCLWDNKAYSKCYIIVGYEMFFFCKLGLDKI
jgi:hypothetical protein